MSERVIAKPRYITAHDDERQSSYKVVYEYLKDQDAPSVSEIVEVLQETRPYAMLMAVDPEIIDRIDNLIERLER